MKTQHIEGVDINKACSRFVHMKIQQREEEQSVANKRTGKK